MIVRALHEGWASTRGNRAEEVMILHIFTMWGILDFPGCLREYFWMFTKHVWHLHTQGNSIPGLVALHTWMTRLDYIVAPMEHVQ